MIYFVLFVLFIFVIVKLSSSSLLSSVTAIDALARTGVRARGLVLSSTQLATGVTLAGGRRFVRRTLVIDVEIPGRAPYVTRGFFLVPRGVSEATPGSSLELAVDPAKPNRVVVLGPAGFTGPWLQLGAPNPY